MRHGKKHNHLGRTHSHRKAMLSNMATSLILTKRIETTLAKAKELRKYVEPLITRSKTDDTNSRRVVFSYLQSKEAIKELFGEISQKVADRPGGYTRIIKLGTRLGDNAERALIELVDFNEIYGTKDEAAESRKTRRSRRGSKKGADVVSTPDAVAAVEVAEPIAVAEEVAVVVEEAPAVDGTPASDEATEEKA